MFFERRGGLRGESSVAAVRRDRRIAADGPRCRGRDAGPPLRRRERRACAGSDGAVRDGRGIFPGNGPADALQHGGAGRALFRPGGGRRHRKQAADAGRGRANAGDSGAGAAAGCGGNLPGTDVPARPVRGRGGAEESRGAVPEIQQTADGSSPGGIQGFYGVSAAVRPVPPVAGGGRTAG